MPRNKASSWLKWFLVLLVLAGGLGAGVWYWNKPGESPTYTTAPVTRGDLVQAVTATGTLNPVTNVTVGSQISGIIQKLLADWNTPVKANQVVAELDPATYKAAVAQAEGELANATANLELQQVQTRRAEALAKDRLLPQA
ncbi:MAG TPA: biotin/lipoyl-binding protein, partial [Candidatus Eisenbacteria bacterium]|nr:biotin/lipoyl-binding protein [Candidatus Eisenbacteria bacterium]